MQDRSLEDCGIGDLVGSQKAVQRRLVTSGRVQTPLVFHTLVLCCGRKLLLTFLFVLLGGEFYLAASSKDGRCWKSGGLQAKWSWTGRLLLPGGPKRWPVGCREERWLFAPAPVVTGSLPSSSSTLGWQKTNLNREKKYFEQGRGASSAPALREKLLGYLSRLYQNFILYNLSLYLKNIFKCSH